MKKQNIIRYRRIPGEPLSEQARKELEALEAMPDSEIDYTDIPKDTDWSGAVRGWENRPRKKPISIRLDSDIIAFFKARSDKYQSAINRVLRDYVEAQRK